MAQRSLPDLRNDPKLARFVVEGNPTGIHLGNGSYGSVEEVQRINTEERLPNFRVSVTGFGFRGPVSIFASRSSVLIRYSRAKF